MFLPSLPSPLPPNTPFLVDELAYKSHIDVAEKLKLWVQTLLAIGDVRISLTSNKVFFLNPLSYFLLLCSRIYPPHFSFFKYILLIMLLQFSQFSPLYFPCTLPTLQHSPSLSSCSWVVHISSLTSLFPILFLTSPCLFYAYQLCFLLPVPFPPILPLLLPTENPPCDVHFSDSVPVLLVCLVFVFVFSFSLFYSHIYPLPLDLHHSIRKLRATSCYFNVNELK